MLDTLQTLFTLLMMLSSPKRLKIFYARYPSIHKTPQPIFRHWGTCLQVTFSYAEVFKQVKPVTSEFNFAEAAATRESQS